MNKSLKSILLVGLAICVAVPVYAQNVRSTFGNKDSTNTYAIEEKSDDIVYFRPSGGIKFPYESVTTSDTLTAQESGTTYVYSGTVNSVFTLPAAAVGMEFSFVSTGDSSTFALDPDGTDTIKWDISSVPLDGGDKLISPGATEDSITIFSGVANEWAVKSINGTFTDGG